MTIAILVKSSINKDGYLGPDSTNYLRLSQNLLEGKGYYVSTYDFETKKEKTFFAVWPVGYPTLIFIISKFSNIGVFWASKFLNIIFVVISILLLRYQFRESAFIYALVFFAAPYIVIFSYTWSEVPFIFGLIWFSVSIINFVPENKNIWLVNIFLSSVFLFLVRYIGFFSFISLIILTIFYFFKGEYKLSFRFAFISSLGLLIAFIYLYHNFLSTGYITGIPRIKSPETNIELLTNLSIAVIKEFNLLYANWGRNKMLFFATFIFEAILFMYFLKKVKIFSHFKKVNIKIDALSSTFFFIGSVYWVSIVLIRWVNHYDDFYYRLLGPATFLFVMAIINFIQYNCEKTLIENFERFFIILLLFSYILTVPLQSLFQFFHEKVTYKDTLKTISNRYAFLPPNSVIIFGDAHLRYIRTDVIELKPSNKPYSSKSETIEEFLKKVKKIPNRSIYFEIPKTKECSSSKGDFFTFIEYDGSVVDFLKSNKDKDFIKIK